MTSVGPTAGAISAKDVMSDPDGGFPIDDAVKEALPAGLEFKSVTPFGISAWTVTGRLVAEDASGDELLFFLKIAYGEHGGVILQGEYESAKEIYRLNPGLIPEPFSYGRYKGEDPITYFYLSEFVDMDVNAAPDPAELAAKLSQMHLKSESPTGKFGFHVVTCDGKMPHTVDWQDSWADFYARLLGGICKIDVENNGPWPELERATDQLITKVIPRLLGDLRHEGKPIKPCIIHGDLWEPNMGIRYDNGELIMYDVGSYYAHNEMDLGTWRGDFSAHLRSPVYTQAYLRNYPAAEPQDEFDDRNQLYRLKSLINYSAGHPRCVTRQTAYNSMCYLCNKYAPVDGIDEYDPQKDPSVTGAHLMPTFTKPPALSAES